jgi:hypothetical protein
LIETLTQLRIETLGLSGLSIAVVRPTGIEPKSAKTSDESEQPDIINISKLKKAEG